MTNLQLSFKDIPGYENCYLITETGIIKGVHFRGKERILKHSITKKGYHKIKLQKDGVKKNTYVAILVAKTYIPNPLNLPQVNHKDGDKDNNCKWNLEWCTNQQNIDHRQKVLFTEEKRIAHKQRCQTKEFKQKISNVSKGALNGSAKKVIDTSTGEVFGCIGDAAEKHGYTYNQLKQWLNGRRINKSTLKHL